MFASNTNNSKQLVEAFGSVWVACIEKQFIGKVVSCCLNMAQVYMLSPSRSRPPSTLQWSLFALTGIHNLSPE
eukprot:3590854-Amphidinium_carterae.1